MEKVDRHFIIEQYSSGVTNYQELTTELGLWASERYVLQKYLNQKDRILDMGCGTGRTTFGLHRLGYRDLLGIDLTPAMIDAAQQFNTHFATEIDFRVGDATQIDLPSEQFDAVIFSFNGLMSIPEATNRRKAVQEIHRVLKPGGIFIFTTHDQKADPKYLQFWQEEKERWATGQQRDDLYEFGDLITSSKNETQQIYIHIPTQEEVRVLLNQANFSVLETFYRNEKFTESTAVKKKSGECRFWVASKP